MAKFSEAIHEDLETMRKKMAENARAADSFSETLLSNANEWRAKLKQAFQSTSNDVEVSIFVQSKTSLLTNVLRMSTPP